MTEEIDWSINNSWVDRFRYIVLLLSCLERHLKSIGRCGAFYEGDRDWHNELVLARMDGIVKA